MSIKNGCFFRETSASEIKHSEEETSLMIPGSCFNALSSKDWFFYTSHYFTFSTASTARIISFAPTSWKLWSKWHIIGVFTIGQSDAILSDCLTDLKLHSTKKFCQKLPQWGLNPWPPDHQYPALPTELARNLLEISEVSFLLFHALLLESIEHDFIKALMIHTHNQIVT